jgi:DNA-binding NtrC family response regulator
MERAANYAQKGRITPEHLPSYLMIGNRNSTVEEHVEQVIQYVEQDEYREKLNIAERDLILSMLEKTGGNKSKAAKLLNMSRTRFYARLRKLGIKQ